MVYVIPRLDHVLDVNPRGVGRYLTKQLQIYSANLWHFSLKLFVWLFLIRTMYLCVTPHQQFSVTGQIMACTLRYIFPFKVYCARYTNDHSRVEIKLSCRNFCQRKLIFPDKAINIQRSWALGGIKGTVMTNAITWNRFGFPTYTVNLVFLQFGPCINITHAHFRWVP